ncbi:MAG TPA: hypothetical protein VJ044_19755 [Candidatus Hodarchaeales archaeon]|nr:hypothetical protein [Candidatus Hodarchaeales archaeon]
MRLFQTNLTLAYLWVIAGALIFFQYALFTLGVLVTVPIARRALDHIKKHFEAIYELLPGNALTIGIHLMAGVLLILGFKLTKILAPTV